jgi:hypothetical protein
VRPFTAATTSGNARSEDDTQSSCRLQIETTIAAALSSTDRFASSPVSTPTMIGPRQISRIHLKSSHVTTARDNADPTSINDIGPFLNHYIFVSRHSAIAKSHQPSGMLQIFW